MASSGIRPTSSLRLGSLTFAAAFAAGTALALLPAREWPAILGPLAVLAVVPIGLAPDRLARLRRVVVLLVLGLILATGHHVSDRLDRWPAVVRGASRHAGPAPVEIEGRLVDWEMLPEGRVALIVRVRSIVLGGPPSRRIRARVRLVARLTAPLPEDGAEPPIRPGQGVALTARIGAPRNFQNPGAFDYASYLRAAGIDLVGSVKSWRLIRTVPEDRAWLWGIVPAVRRAILTTLQRAAGQGNDETVSFLSALLLGERQELPPALEEALLGAGVFHIIALSGFNVALVAALVSSLVRWLPVPPWIRRALVAATVTAYWALARSSGSMARATVMALLYLGGRAVGRRVSGIGTLSAASVLLLLTNPFWVLDAGFHLSAAATLAILILAPPAEDSRAGPRGAGPGRSFSKWTAPIRKTVRDSIRVSAAALAGTILVTARHFQTVTPIGLVANLFAVPISGLLIALGAAAIALEPLAHGAASALLQACRILVASLERLCGLLTSVPGASVHVVPPPAGLVLIGLVAVVVIGAGPRACRRPAAALFGCLLAATLMAGRVGRPAGRLEIVMIDVGQGDAILIRYPGGTTMLIDAGGFARSPFDVGAKVVAPALRALGILKLDILAITHAHRDHIGGAPAIVRQFSPRAVWLGRMPEDDRPVETLERIAEADRIPIVFPRRGVRLRIESTDVEVLNPGPGVAAGGPASNNDSLVLRLSFKGTSVLLTGDLEEALESVLVREGRDLSAGLLKVGHHGSRTSTSSSFLDRVHPRFAAISVGTGNPWGHPNDEVLDRLAGEGAVVLSTDQDGAVRFWTDGVSGWAVERLAGAAAPPRE